MKPDESHTRLYPSRHTPRRLPEPPAYSSFSSSCLSSSRHHTRQTLVRCPHLPFSLERASALRGQISCPWGHTLSFWTRIIFNLACLCTQWVVQRGWCKSRGPQVEHTSANHAGITGSHGHKRVQEHREDLVLPP